MINRTTKLRWRRRFRSRKRQVEGLSVHAEEQLDRHLIRRIGRLIEVRRFVLTWILLLLILISGVVVQVRGLSEYYQAEQPVAGGTYTEGIIGSFTNANPLYATGPVDSSVSRLVFAGLFKYDEANRLVGDLAQGWEVDATGQKYTVTLKPKLTWHDGQELTAQDVVFTYRTIQNPDAKSPLQGNWAGIEVTATNKRTIVFTLPNALSAFPYSMTNGIAPKHLLDGQPVSQLRSLAFNTVGPVGSGPFKWQALEVTGATVEDREERIALVPFAEYNGGKPRLDQFIIRTFRAEATLAKVLKNHELNGAVGLETAPDQLDDSDAIYEHSFPLTGAVMAFFNTSMPALGELQVRQALVAAVNPQDVRDGLGYPVIAAHGPLLQDQLGYDRTILQLPPNVETANQLLDAAGWVRSGNGPRMKNGTTLAISITAKSNSEYLYVTQKLQNAWKALGIEVDVQLLADEEIQNTLLNHEKYQVLVYGISMGIDPDIFPYWHSSQTARTNFSEYRSSIADVALESGRTRSDAGLRALKYRPFLEAWRNDAPALALYQPRFLYVTYGEVFGLAPRTINSSVDRYNNVENWMIRQELSTL